MLMNTSGEMFCFLGFNNVFRGELLVFVSRIGPNHHTVMEVSGSVEVTLIFREPRDDS